MDLQTTVEQDAFDKGCVWAEGSRVAGQEEPPDCPYPQDDWRYVVWLEGYVAGLPTAPMRW